MGNDARDFAVNWATDSAFGENLQRAIEAGVEVYVYTCSIDLTGIAYTGTIPFTGGNSMEVYALIGASGTGKSHNANSVLEQYHIDMMIDDGL